MGSRRLTGVILVGAGNLIINTLLVWRRFLLNIAGANRVDIFINYRAASTNQFDGISEIIAVMGV